MNEVEEWIQLRLLHKKLDYIIELLEVGKGVEPSDEASPSPA